MQWMPYISHVQQASAFSTMTQQQPIIDCTNGDDRWIDLSDRGNADGKAAEDPKFTPNWHELFLRGQKRYSEVSVLGTESPVYSILWLHYPGVHLFPLFPFFSLLIPFPTNILPTVHFQASSFIFFLPIPISLSLTRSLWRRHSARTTSRRIARAIAHGLSLTRMFMMSPSSKTSTLVRPPIYKRCGRRRECSVRWSSGS